MHGRPVDLPDDDAPTLPFAVLVLCVAVTGLTVLLGFAIAAALA